MSGCKPKATEIDARIGRRLRELRSEERVSQSALGEALGVSFQQIQKYEAGTDRISASRLWLAAQAFDRDLAWFFEEARDE